MSLSKLYTIIQETVDINNVNTGIIYLSVTVAAQETAHTIQSVCAVCNGKKEKVGDDRFCYVLDSDQC